MPRLLVVWTVFLISLIALDYCCTSRMAKSSVVRMRLIETIDERRERIIIEEASRCGVNPYLAREYLHIEDLAGIPPQYRGLLAAKACTETRAVGVVGSAQCKAITAKRSVRCNCTTIGV